MYYFDRPAIKESAKQCMSGRMGAAIGVGFLGSLLTGGTLTTAIRQLSDMAKNDLTLARFLVAAFPYLMGIMLIELVYVCFIGGVISYGTDGWFLKYWRGENPRVGEMFRGFRHYGAFLCTHLLSSLYVFLWTLLLIVPGIVMSYAYSMAPYIINDNPRLSASQALNISKRMTNGYKGELFVMALSFFGWHLLGALTLGIVSIVYVVPYSNTSFAGAYEALRWIALQTGRVSYEELGMAPPPQNPAAPYGGQTPRYGGYSGQGGYPPSGYPGYGGTDWYGRPQGGYPPVPPAQGGYPPQESRPYPYSASPPGSMQDDRNDSNNS